jgi:hypothetical protein
MGTHRFELASIDASLVGNLSEPGLVASTLAGRPQIDVTLANDALLPDLVIAMAQFGYAFLASAPTTPRATSNLLVDMSDPGATTTVAPADTMRARYDNTQKALVMSVDGGAYFPLAVNPANGASFFEDFLTQSGTILGATNWIAGTNGAGSAVNVGGGAAPATLDAIHQGILTMQTGPTNTGIGSARQANLAYSNVAATAGGNSRLEFLTTLGDVLPSAVDDYTVMHGWSNNAGVAGYGTSAALFVIDRAVSATNWCTKTLGGVGSTTLATTVPISAAGTWDKLLIDLSAAGARFFVNGVLTNTHALAQLPAATVGWAPITKIQKLPAPPNPSTAQRRLHVDYASWSYRLSSAR